MRLNPDLQNWDAELPASRRPALYPVRMIGLWSQWAGGGGRRGETCVPKMGQAEGGALGGVSVRGSWARGRDPWASSCLSPVALPSVVPTHLATSC